MCNVFLSCLRFDKIATNGLGFVQVGFRIPSSPQPLMIENILLKLTIIVQR